MNFTLLSVIFFSLIAHSIWKRVMPKKMKLRRSLKELMRFCLHLYRHNKDIYSEELNFYLLEKEKSCKEMLENKELPEEELEKFLDTTKEEFKSKIPKPNSPKIAENIDICVVAFSLAFSARALFLQPFIIPTGSMQPTLHGLNYYDVTHKEITMGPGDFPGEKDKQPASFKRFLHILFYSRGKVDIELNGSIFAGNDFDYSRIRKVGKGEMIRKQLGIPF